MPSSRTQLTEHSAEIVAAAPSGKTRTVDLLLAGCRTADNPPQPVDLLVNTVLVRININDGSRNRLFIEDRINQNDSRNFLGGGRLELNDGQSITANSDDSNAYGAVIVASWTDA